MQIPRYFVFVVFAILAVSSYGWAQGKAEREVEIHKNIKLIEMSIAEDIPAEIAKQYRSFLPVFEESLKESTVAQTDECFLTIRVNAGVKEIGAAKTKRPRARITAFRRNSKQEFVGELILYSYVNAGPLSKEEVTQFLKKQILEPAECK